VRGLTRQAWLALLGMAAAAILIGCGSNGESSAEAGSARCGGDAVKNASEPTSGEGIPGPNAALAEYGQSDDDPCVYEGPGGFSLDLADCPSDWDINAGISETEIRLFTSMPHSGALAAQGGIGDGIKSYVDYVNEQGGVAGRKIVFDIQDDQYQPDLTRRNVDSAIQSNDFAASYALLGTANNLNVREVMNEQCMPQLGVASSDVRFFDPQGYPWTTGFGLDRLTETDLWAQWLQEEYPDGAKVVMITMDNDLGKSYADGFRRAAEGTDLEIVGDELHDVAAPSIENQITSAAATKADVVLLNTAGAFCIQGLEGIEKSSWEPLIISGNACAQISTTYAPLAKQGATGNGSQVIRYYYAPTDPDADDPEFAQLLSDTVEAQGLDPANAQYANGWWWGWHLVQSIQDAATMKGGLNRANLVVANRSIDSTWPLMVDGVKGKSSGVEDAFPFEAGQMYRYEGASGSKLGKFEPVGPLIDNEGKLMNFQSTESGG
jgi:branched-chain amino acid transport system substrate-binding protein